MKFNLSKHIGKLFIVMASVVMMGLNSCKEDIDDSNLYTFTGETIEDYIANRPDQFSNFNYILKRIGYDQILSAYGTYTCFAPTNDAVTAYVDGMAASIASVIALAADRTVMRTGSVMMIHKPALVMMGVYNADELMKLASDIDAVQRCIMQVYEKHGKIDTSEIEEKVNAETWLPAEEAADVFDIDVETEEAVAAVGSEFIARVASKVPPQYAQEPKPPSDEDRNKAKLEILELEGKK